MNDSPLWAGASGESWWTKPVSAFFFFLFIPIMLFGTRVKCSRSCAHWELLHIWHLSEVWHWLLEQSYVNELDNRCEFIYQISESVRITKKEIVISDNFPSCKSAWLFSLRNRKWEVLFGQICPLNSVVCAPYNCSCWLATSDYCFLSLFLELRY